MWCAVVYMEARHAEIMALFQKTENTGLRVWGRNCPTCHNPPPPRVSVQPHECAFVLLSMTTPCVMSVLGTFRSWFSLAMSEWHKAGFSLFPGDLISCQIPDKQWASLAYLFIVLPKVTWTSAISVFRTHLNTAEKMAQLFFFFLN